MFTAFIAYLVASGALAVMSSQLYVFPWFRDKVIIIGNPMASFLWPLGMVVEITGGLFGLFKTSTLRDRDKDE